MSSLTNLFPISHLLPGKALLYPTGIDLPNWNLAWHHWLLLRSTVKCSHVELTTARIRKTGSTTSRGGSFRGNPKVKLPKLSIQKIGFLLSKSLWTKALGTGHSLLSPLATRRLGVPKAFLLWQLNRNTCVLTFKPDLIYLPQILPSAHVYIYLLIHLFISS